MQFHALAHELRAPKHYLYSATGPTPTFAFFSLFGSWKMRQTNKKMLKKHRLPPSRNRSKLVIASFELRRCTRSQFDRMGLQIFRTVQEVTQWRTGAVGDRRKISIGFVPTMGCLHAGHASLIKQCRESNDYVVVSIFVNPSQFAPTEDLDKYPRTLANDIDLLKELNVDVLFQPSPHEMYPQGIPLHVSEQRGPFVTVLGVSEMLEGSTRPNFFRGVATVVTKLLNIVMPDVAYFGQKDIQQFIVLNVMVQELFVNTKLVMMPICRDSSGLALSSRNKYLCQDSLKVASSIYAGLSAATTLIKEQECVVERETILTKIGHIWEPYVQSGDFEIDYISIADIKSLAEKREIKPQEDGLTVISCAVYVRDRKHPETQVRLIDNIIL